MLRLLIPSYPLPSPALMAFRLYLALLAFLLECILTLATTLLTSHHQNIPAAWSWHRRQGLGSCFLPNHPRPRSLQLQAAGDRGLWAVGDRG